jgi:hypothetical protein
MPYSFHFIFGYLISSAQVCCCFGTSVSSTRYLLQDEFNIQTTPCDNCIIVIDLSLLMFRALSLPSHLKIPFSLQRTCFLVGIYDHPQTNFMYILNPCLPNWKFGNQGYCRCIGLHCRNGLLLVSPSPHASQLLNTIHLR